MKKLLNMALIVSALFLNVSNALPIAAQDIKSQFPDLGGNSGGGGFNGSPGANGFAGNNFGPNNFGPNNFGPNNFGPNNFGPNSFGPNNFNAGNVNKNSDVENQALLKRINFDPRMMVRPDTYADYPSTDSSGGRHFGNGRHYDLASTSVRAAVAQLNSADVQLQQEALQRQIRKNRGNLPF